MFSCAIKVTATKIRFRASIPESIDWDIKEPTAPQLSYAMVISRQLGIAPPAEAMAYRGHMVQFIEEYAPILKERSKASRKKSEND